MSRQIAYEAYCKQFDSKKKPSYPKEYTLPKGSTFMEGSLRALDIPGHLYLTPDGSVVEVGQNVLGWKVYAIHSTKEDFIFFQKPLSYRMFFYS